MELTCGYVAGSADSYTGLSLYSSAPLSPPSRPFIETWFIETRFMELTCRYVAGSADSYTGLSLYSSAPLSPPSRFIETWFTRFGSADGPLLILISTALSADVRL